MMMAMIWRWFDCLLVKSFWSLRPSDYTQQQQSTMWAGALKEMNARQNRKESNSYCNNDIHMKLTRCSSLCKIHKEEWQIGLGFILKDLLDVCLFSWPLVQQPNNNNNLAYHRPWKLSSYIFANVKLPLLEQSHLLRGDFSPLKRYSFNLNWAT